MLNLFSKMSKINYRRQNKTGTGSELRGACPAFVPPDIQASRAEIGEKVVEEKVVSRYKRFARSFRSMSPRNFDDTSNVKFLKSRPDQEKNSMARCFYSLIKYALPFLLGPRGFLPLLKKTT